MPTTRAQDVAASRRLRGTIELVLPGLFAAGRRLVAHPRIRELYPEYLFTMHAIVRASVPLMEAARREAEAMAADDQVAAALAPYLAEHITEELDHDEWLLRDVEAVGGDRASFLARPPSPTVAGLVGAQYYWIFHYHPVALLGYIAVLEGYPPTRVEVDELVARTGYGSEAFETLIKHAELDPHHREELDEALDGLPLTPEQSVVMGLSGLHTVHMLTLAVSEILDDAGAR